MISCSGGCGVQHDLAPGVSVYCEPCWLTRAGTDEIGILAEVTSQVREAITKPARCRCPMLVGGGIDHRDECRDRR